MGGTFRTSFLARLLGCLFALALLAGCAVGPAPDDTAALDSEQLAAAGDEDQLADLEIDEPSDPIELINRFIFAINEALDTFVLRPVAATYRFLLPDEVRDSVRSFVRNVATPVVLINDLLQGSWDRAQTTATRFAINSTAGVAGFWDAADHFGYPYHDEDFGQTLGVWGAGPGPYLVLPVFGPSSVRDATGRVVDTFLDPLTYVGFYYDEAEAAQLGLSATRGIDFRSRNIETLDELKRDSVDFYARVRSVYLQRRIDEINNGEIREDLPTPGLSGGEPGVDQVSGSQGLYE